MLPWLCKVHKSIKSERRMGKHNVVERPAARPAWITARKLRRLRDLFAREGGLIRENWIPTEK